MHEGHALGPDELGRPTLRAQHFGYVITLICMLCLQLFDRSHVRVVLPICIVICPSPWQVPTIPFMLFASASVVQQPLGVVLVISPWNFPFSEWDAELVWSPLPPFPLSPSGLSVSPRLCPCCW